MPSTAPDHARPLRGRPRRSPAPRRALHRRARHSIFRPRRRVRIAAHEDATETLVGPAGRLRLCTVVANRPPGYRGPLPYGFGVVELDGTGLEVITRLTESDPARLRPGLAVRLVVEPLFADDDGTPVLSYAFAPDPAAPASMRPVYVAGVGLHPFGRFADREPHRARRGRGARRARGRRRRARRVPGRVLRQRLRRRRDRPQGAHRARALRRADRQRRGGLRQRRRGARRSPPPRSRAASTTRCSSSGSRRCRAA